MIPFKTYQEKKEWHKNNCAKCQDKATCHAVRCIIIVDDIDIAILNWIGWQNNKIVNICNNFIKK